MSIISRSANTETAIHENYEVNMMINGLAKLQENCGTIAPFVYEANMIPIFQLFDKDEEPLYCVDADLFTKMVNSKDIPVSTGVEDLLRAASDECDEDVCVEQLAIIFKAENIGRLNEAVHSDASKFKARVAALEQHNELINSILECGVRILFN